MSSKLLTDSSLSTKGLEDHGPSLYLCIVSVRKGERVSLCIFVYKCVYVHRFMHICVCLSVCLCCRNN